MASAALSPGIDKFLQSLLVQCKFFHLMNKLLPPCRIKVNLNCSHYDYKFIESTVSEALSKTG
jgi:hypothetical protein